MRANKKTLAVGAWHKPNKKPCSKTLILSYDQLVHSNIISHIDYNSCNSVYGGLTERNLFNLQKMQNNAVRFIFGLYGKQRRTCVRPEEASFLTGEV